MSLELVGHVQGVPHKCPKRNFSDPCVTKAAGGDHDNYADVAVTRPE